MPLPRPASSKLSCNNAKRRLLHDSGYALSERGRQDCDSTVDASGRGFDEVVLMRSWKSLDDAAWPMYPSRWADALCICVRSCACAIAHSSEAFFCRRLSLLPGLRLVVSEPAVCRFLSDENEFVHQTLITHHFRSFSACSD